MEIFKTKAPAVRPGSLSGNVAGGVGVKWKAISVYEEDAFLK